jgi:hypothetical protein
MTDEDITIIDKAIAALENSVEVSQNGSKSAVRFNVSIFNWLNEKGIRTEIRLYYDENLDALIDHEVRRYKPSGGYNGSIFDTCCFKGPEIKISSETENRDEAYKNPAITLWFNGYRLGEIRWNKLESREILVVWGNSKPRKIQFSGLVAGEAPDQVMGVFVDNG